MKERRPFLLIVTGPPGAGKTTLARRLAADLPLPLLSRDDLKEILFDALGWSDRDWSRRMGVASWRLLNHLLAELMRGGGALIVDSNFREKLDGERLRRRLGASGATAVQLFCHAETAVLIERFRQRAGSGERHAGHVDEQNVAEFAAGLASEPWQPLALDGRLLSINTTDWTAVDYDPLLSLVRELI